MKLWLARGHCQDHDLEECPSRSEYTASLDSSQLQMFSVNLLTIIQLTVTLSYVELYSSVT